MYKISTTTVLLTLVAIVISACAATEPPVNTNQPVAEEPATIEQPPETSARLDEGAWDLISLNGADPVPDSTVFIAFIESRVSGSAGCNRYMGEYTQTEGELSFAPIALTRRACISPDLSRQEMEYSRILGDVSSFQINGDQLVLSTADGQTLTFERQASESDESDESDESSSSDADVETLIVGPNRVHCVGVGPMECLQTRTSADAPWQMMYYPIEGFTHQEGVTSVLRVRRVTVENPPADGSSIRTVLVEIVSQEPATN